MLQITGLTLDYARVKTGVRSHMSKDGSPVVGWAAVSSRPGDAQAACRVTAGAWDSGWIETTDNSLRLSPDTLPRGKGTPVSVQLKSRLGEVSAVRTETVYNAAIVWDAPWIGNPAQRQDRPIYFRGTVDLPENVVSARLYACGLGYQKIALNGCGLGDARLDPAYTDFSKRVNYVLYPDVENLLRSGANEVTAVVGAGWRNNTRFHDLDGWKDKALDFEGPEQFSAILEAELDNGEILRFVTDESWQAGIGPITYSNLYNGEDWDAREAISYGPAALTDVPSGKMEPMILPPITEHETYAPVAWWPDGEDALVLDFGKNLAGLLRIPLPEGLQAGHKITVAHTEELTEDGKLFPDTLRKAKQTDSYIAAGDGRDVAEWQCVFTYHGFRYARIEGLTAAYDPRNVRAVALYTDVAADSFFRCGNALITRLHELCVNTEKSNLHSIMTDCPQRDERMGWMNDATVRFEETPYNFDVGALFPKVVRDLIDIQTPEGAIGCTAPFAFGNKPADPVCSSFLMAGMQAALHTGNLDLVSEAYPAWEAWENCLLAHSDGYLVNYSYYGDWAGPADCCVVLENVPDPGAQSAVTPGVFMSSGYSYWNCRALARFARWLGRDADAARHDATAEHIKDAMLKKWYDPETGGFGTGSQACLAFALWLGIAPDPDRTALRLHEAVEQAGWRLTTGNLCSRYIMDVLVDHGYGEDAWKLMTREEYPSLGFMLQQEATTIWERFELMKCAGMNSHNHPMYGAVDYWMYACLAGLRCAELGWKKFTVKPFLPEKLMSAQAAVETPLGRVSVRWTKRYGGAHLQLTVPFGAEAEIDFCGVKKTVGSGFHTISVNL